MINTERSVGIAQGIQMSTSPEMKERIKILRMGKIPKKFKHPV